jgi:hypothetical protein
MQGRKFTNSVCMSTPRNLDRILDSHRRTEVHMFDQVGLGDCFVMYKVNECDDE